MSRVGFVLLFLVEVPADARRLRGCPANAAYRRLLHPREACPAKITLKNQVDDLLDRFREYYQGEATVSITSLRRSYDLLIMKVLSLLQDEDPTLAAAIVSSREALWDLLADPKTFANLEA